jgi:hypothetical protein
VAKSKDADQSLAAAAGLPDGVVPLLRRHGRKRVDRLLATTEDGGTTPAAGLSVPVADGEAAEDLMTALRPRLVPLGCRAFWSERPGPGGSGRADEVIIVPAGDPYAPLRLRRTDGANYDVSTDDILDRLRQWEQLCRFEVVGAAASWAALKFETLPSRPCAFPEEVYLFCPDTVTQGVGLKKERDHPADFEAARRLCPELSPAVREHVTKKVEAVMARSGELPPQLRAMLANTADAAVAEAETGVRLLAAELHRTMYLFLWWD